MFDLHSLHVDDIDELDYELEELDLEPDYSELCPGMSLHGSLDVPDFDELDADPLQFADSLQ